MVVLCSMGNRRARFVGVALLMTVVVLWLGYQAQLAPTTLRQAPFEVRPQSPPTVEKPIGPQGQHGDHQGDVKVLPEKPTHDGGEKDAGMQKDSEEEELVITTAASTFTSASTATSVATSTSTSAALPTEDAVPSVNCTALRPPLPDSEGDGHFPYARPPPECRTFRLPELEAVLGRTSRRIEDRALIRLFRNSYSHTLDTMIRWRGYAHEKQPADSGQIAERPITDEELTFVVTREGSHVMYLRDSVAHIVPYERLLEPSKEPDSLASLWRGLINLQSRYILAAPLCDAFQPPDESNIAPQENPAPALSSTGSLPFDPKVVYDCRWELSNLASFLQLSAVYYYRTEDLEFFAKYSWVDAIAAIIDTAEAMRNGTVDIDGNSLVPAWPFNINGSEGLLDAIPPVKENGMIRSAFRPNGEPAVRQLVTPSNIMFAVYLEHAAAILEALSESVHGNDQKKAGKRETSRALDLATRMRALATGIGEGIKRDAVVKHPDFGEIFAYAVDGNGGVETPDDAANYPSLLAMSLWNFTLPERKEKTKQPQVVKSVKHADRRDTGEEETQHENAIQEEKVKEEKPATTTFAIAAATASTATAKAVHITTSTSTSAHSTQPASTPESQYSYTAIYRSTRRFALSSSNTTSSSLSPSQNKLALAAISALTALDPMSGYNVTSSSSANDDDTNIEALAQRNDFLADQIQILLAESATGLVDGWVSGFVGELVIRIAEDEERRGRKGDVLGRLW